MSATKTQKAVKWTCPGCGTTDREAIEHYGKRWARDERGRQRCQNCHTLRRWETLTMPFSNDALIGRSRREGGHFFDPDTMRFFRSRLAPGVMPKGDRVYFITSEADSTGTDGAWGGERRYTVHYMTAGGVLFKYGEIGEHETLRRARAAMKDAPSIVSTREWTR